MVLVFGSINIDLAARAPRVPGPGETIAGSDFAVSPGGKGANQALAARRAGARVSMVGAVGHDAFATQALALLVADGVDLRAVRAVDAPTGVGLITVADDGANAITVVAGANALAEADQVDAAQLVNAVVVLQFEVPMAEVVTVAQRARKSGARVLLNAAPAQRIPAALFAAIDVLVVNEHEAALIAAATDLPPDPVAFARGVFARYGATTLVTLGAAGVVACGPDFELRLAPPLVAVRDTTGAGDAFVGALAAALDRHAPWPEAIACAVAAGALACEQFGAQSALPDAAAIAAAARRVESQSFEPAPLRP